MNRLKSNKTRELELIRKWMHLLLTSRKKFSKIECFTAARGSRNLARPGEFS